MRNSSDPHKFGACVLMDKIIPSIGLLRVLAGEGKFHLYRQLKQGRRVFIFAKLMLTTLSYFRGRGERVGATAVSFVKGVNQLRYYKYARAQLEDEFGAIQLFVPTPFPDVSGVSMLPRVGLISVLQQAFFLLCLLITGKRRYLNLYLLSFAVAINRVVNEGMSQVNTFICFNDQPYDVAAIVYALNRRNDVRTIVIQHGLILSEEFYFPCVAKEFWAWGELSRRHFRSWSSGSKMLVKGRYVSDKKDKSSVNVFPNKWEGVSILVAPSFFHSDVKELLEILCRSLQGDARERARVAIKFHPATKFLWLLKGWCKKTVPWIGEEFSPMEVLADRYDLLVTKDSTSALDFLLRGKPVFFQNLQDGPDFPSELYGLDVRNISDIFGGVLVGGKNSARLKFIESSLNV